MAWGDRRAVTVVDCYKVSELRVEASRKLDAVETNTAQMLSLKVIPPRPRSDSTIFLK